MSDRNLLLVAWASALLSLAVVGCSPTLEDGRFTCATTADCPSGFSCRSDALCYRGESDGGPEIDAHVVPSEGGVDAGPPARDSGGGDAGPPCGPDCIQLMVLNADPFLVGSVDFMDRSGTLVRISIPAYGATTAVRDVPNVDVGGMLDLFLPGSITSSFPVAIPTENRYLLVLGPGAVAADPVMLEAPPEGLHTGGYVYIRLIDMVADETEGLLVSGAGRNPTDAMMRHAFEHGTVTREELPYLPSGPNAARIELGTTAGTLIAALPADRLPDAEGTYYVVVAGRMRAHLGTEDGLRFIPGLPGASTVRSARLVRFLNTIGTNATVCDADTPLATLANGELSEPFVPPASTAWELTVHTGIDCSTGLTDLVTIGTAAGRTLVSIAGDISTTATWGAVSIAEPMPTVGASTIVFHNGLTASSTIAGATIPMLTTGSIAPAAPPPTIVATTPVGDRTFTWSAMEAQAWGVLVQQSSDYYLYEVDSPYVESWRVFPEVGH